jgi:hypothetical protein
MIETPKIELFLARITKVKDRETYEILVEVPGYGQDIPAVPLSRGEMDEPVEGNLVIIMSLDPYHHNVNFYTKLKENKFVGIRSNGKVLDMTKDYVTLGAEDNSKTHKDTFKQEEHIMAPDKAYIRFDNDGNITIEAVKDLNITIKGGNTTLKSSSTVKVESPDVTITGGKLTVNGSVAPTTGPFNCLTNCLYSGAPHSGNIVTGT